MVSGLAGFTPCGTIKTPSSTKILSHWNMLPLPRVLCLSAHIDCMVLSDDHRFLYTVTAERVLYKYALSPFKELRSTFLGFLGGYPEKFVWDFCTDMVLCDDKTLYIANHKCVLVWDVEQWTRVNLLRGHNKRLRHMVLSSTHKQLYTLSADRTIRVWDTQTHVCVHIFQCLNNRHMSASPANNYLCVGCGEDTQIWDMGTSPGYSPIHIWSVCDSWAFVFSRDAKHMYMVDYDFDGFVIIETKTGHPVSQIGSCNSPISFLSSPDGRWLYSEHRTNATKLVVWDTTTCQCIDVITAPIQWSSSLQRWESCRPQLSTDGTRCYTIGLIHNVLEFDTTAHVVCGWCQDWMDLLHVVQ